MCFTPLKGSSIFECTSIQRNQYLSWKTRMDDEANQMNMKEKSHTTGDKSRYTKETMENSALLSQNDDDVAACGNESSDGDFKVHVFSSSSELLEKLQTKWSSVKKPPYAAMYSSIYGGIILDPEMMVIPIDDHMVHRGHGVFDTTVIWDGCLCDLDIHLDRILRSASKAKISLPFPRSTLRTILIQTTAASKCREGILKFWLSSGPGNFSLSPAGCPASAFYAIVIADKFSPRKKGVKVITSTVPMKPPLYSTVKNVNYLPNVLSIMEAEEKGAVGSIWVDNNGYIAEGPNVNVAFITKDKELVLPEFDKILSGCAAIRLLELAPELVKQGKLKGARTGNITVKEARDAAEMMFVGSTLPILPIVMWDEQPIGDGKGSGELTMAIADLLWDEMVAGPAANRFPIPYEY